MKLVVSLVLAIVVFLTTCHTSFAYNIRIGLKINSSEASIASSSNTIVLSNLNKKALFKINKLYKYTVYAKNNNIFFVNTNNQTINTTKKSLLIVPSETSGFVYCNDKWYRGHLKINAHNNKINIINVVDLEDYLKGVVPSEMPYTWNIEALKAQAITARSYALANINKHASSGYDLRDTQADQVYKGVSVEKNNPSKAVISTEGQVLVSENKIIPAYYHSCSGGYTDNEGWSQKINFVRPVRSHDSKAPKASWKKVYSKTDLNNRLSYYGYGVDQINSIYPTSSTDYGRIKELIITGKSKNKTISGAKMQSIFKLPSNNFNVISTNSSIIISGKGFGHGIGMSQWGAKELADKGYNAYQILAYFYKNVEIRRLNNKKSHT